MSRMKCGIVCQHCVRYRTNERILCYFLERFLPLIKLRFCESIWMSWSVEKYWWNVHFQCLLLFWHCLPSDAITQHRTWSTLAQVMACCLRTQAITKTNVELPPGRPSDNHLSANDLNIEAEWHIYVPVNYAIIGHIIACRLFGANPLYEQMLAYRLLDQWERNSVTSES